MTGALEQMRDEFAARVERLNSWVPPRERRRREHREWAAEAMTVCARAFVLHGDRAWMDREIMSGLWDWQRFPWKFPPSDNQLAALGGTGAVYRRIAAGGLGMDKEHGPWNGGFFRGLQMSGALRPYSGRQWAIWEAIHQDLVMDMETMVVFNRLERVTGRNGIRRLRRCPASFLPAEPPDGDSVIAGLFAGSQIRRVGNEDWMEMPGSDEVIGLLGKWGILWRSGRTFRGKRTMLVPPFYGPLFVDIMPPRSMARLLEIRNPALCPHLPALYWDLVLGGEGTPVIPFTRALPFSCSMRTFRRRGWRRRDLHLTAVRMGINAVEPGLAARMRAWYDAQPRMRVDRESMVSGAIPPPVASPGIDRGSAENGP